MLPATHVPALPDGLLESLLEQAFPFHLLLDADGCVRRVGPSLAKVCPDVRVGAPAEHVLRVTTPRGATWRREGGALPRGLVLAESAGALVLRGQLLPAGDGTLFVGSPWVTSMAGLTGLGLRLDDFAAADPITDLLLLLGAQASALADAQQLAAQLQESVAVEAHRAGHDGLTGLPNRSCFADRLDDAVRAAQAGGGSATVVLLDVDRFKDVNDSFGHAVGDAVLVGATRALRSHLRAEDHLGRLGGEEFLAVLPDTDAAAAAAVTERMRAEVADTIVEHDGEALRVTVSIGMATWEADEAAEALLRRADEALYAAKAAGRDRALSAPATVPRRR